MTALEEPQSNSRQNLFDQEMTQEECAEIQKQFQTVAKNLSNLSRLPEIEKKIDREVENGANGFKEVSASIRTINDRVSNHDRRISDLDSRVKHIENLSVHTKMSVDTNTEMQRQHFEFTKQSFAQIAQSIDLLSKVDSKEKKPSKSKWYASLPWPAWLAGALVVIGIASMFTGHFAEFMQVLSKAEKVK